MAHSAGRSNGVVADENEMESECVFLVGVAWRRAAAHWWPCSAAVGLRGDEHWVWSGGGGRADAGHLLFWIMWCIQMSRTQTFTHEQWRKLICFLKTWYLLNLSGKCYTVLWTLRWFGSIQFKKEDSKRASAGARHVCTYFTYLRSVVVATTSWIYVSSERIHVDLHSCSVLLLLSLLYLHVYVLWLQLASSTWKLWRNVEFICLCTLWSRLYFFFSKTRVKLIECPRGYTIYIGPTF